MSNLHDGQSPMKENLELRSDGSELNTQDSRLKSRDFRVGDSASFSKTITEADIVLYAGISGDTNPLHLDAEFASRSRFGRRIAHGMLSVGLLSALMGTKLPGPGAIYAGQTLRFLAPVYIGDTVTATVTVDTYDTERGKMTLSTVCHNQDGQMVISGEALLFYKPS